MLRESRLLANEEVLKLREQTEQYMSRRRLEIDETVRHAGENALFELGLTGVAPELVHTLGKLKFRTEVVDGLENALETMRKLYSGEHSGKLLIRVAEEA